MPTWNIGDRVVSLVDHPEGKSTIVSGMSGYICSFNEIRARNGYSSVGVCWDENIRGHNCGGHCEDGHGWYVYEDSIAPELISDFDVATDDELMSLLGGG